MRGKQERIACEERIEMDAVCERETNAVEKAVRTRGAAPVGAINSGSRIRTRKATPFSERRSDAKSRPPDEGRTAMREVCIIGLARRHRELAENREVCERREDSIE